MPSHGPYFTNISTRIFAGPLSGRVFAPRVCVCQPRTDVLFCRCYVLHLRTPPQPRLYLALTRQFSRSVQPYHRPKPLWKPTWRHTHQTVIGILKWFADYPTKAQYVIQTYTILPKLFIFSHLLLCSIPSPDSHHFG